LLWCVSIRIQPVWLRPESRKRRVQFFCETRSSDPIHHMHTHFNIRITLGVRVVSECCARATLLRHVYTVGKKHHPAGRTESR
jgi:hypothetical protein